VEAKGVSHSIRELQRKARYAYWALVRRLSTRSRCPSCSEERGEIVGRSKLLFLARRCSGCGLVYRIPTQFMPGFYETTYHEYSDWYRQLQSGELQQHFRNKFRDSRWDYYDKLSLVTAVRTGGELLDFGGGSGILTWQLQELGFRVTLFEINQKMKVISEDLLGLKRWGRIEELLAAPDRSFDVIFSHHVLEHVEDLGSVLTTFSRLLKDDGLLAVFVPNGGSRTLNGNVAGMLDAAHVSSFEADFFQRNLARFGFEGRTFSMPYAFAASSPGSEMTRQAEGFELALFAWKMGQPPPPALAEWPYRLPSLEHSARAQAGC
jgi:2-polyprenyl-3-methyl-5-hydroxy-6-metoxy-1,4-benzoquinol methylase